MFKKLHLSLLTGAIALAAGSQAFAQTAPTANLTVTGDIAPPACDVSATNDGTYDYGSIAPTVIGAAVYNLGKQTQTLTVTCDAQTYMLFTAIDNEKASVSSASTVNYGLGNVNTTGKLGYYTLNMQNATVDGNTARVGYGGIATGTGLSACYSTTQPVYNTSWKMAWCSTTTTAPIAGQTFVADFVVDAYLNTETGMGGVPTSDTKLNGSTTLTFQFAL